MGLNPAKIVVFGVSSGGTPAASICLMVRDGKPLAIPVKARILYTPM